MDIPEAPTEETEYSLSRPIRQKWYKLPPKIREEVQAALAAGVTWQEIMEDEEIQAAVNRTK